MTGWSNHTLGLLEQLRDHCKDLWGHIIAALFPVDDLLRQLANPNLYDLPMRLPYHVEMWDRSDQHMQRVVAASASVAIAHAAFDVAVESCPGQRFILRKRIQVIREHAPKL